MCEHSDRPSVIATSIPTHICRECWDEKVEPLIQMFPVVRKGKNYRYAGPNIEGGKRSRDQEEF